MTTGPPPPDTRDPPHSTAVLEPPSTPGTIVIRPRILEVIARGARGPLTLVSAPGGTGKTVAVATWAASVPLDGTVVWISVDGTVDAGRLWTVLGDALAGFGLPAAGPVTGYEAGAADQRLAALVYGVARSTLSATVVLDCAVDLPVAVADGLHEILTAGVGRLHLVLLTRADPPLPLHRYRLSDSIVEVRAAELAFRPPEADELLRRRGAELAPDLLEELVARTGGWATGLVLAARSLAGGRAAREVIDTLRGDTGEVGEYLLREVVDTQQPATRDLMLRTSVVPRLEPGITDVLAGPNATQMLTELTHDNTFLSPVHDVRGGFSYHPLVRELLAAELARHAPEEARRLRLLAARWYADRGEVEASVRIAIAADAWAEAAELVIDELLLGGWLLSAHAGELRGLFAAIPPTVPGAAADLVRAAVALARLDYAGCRWYLRAARPGGAVPASTVSARALTAAVLEAACSARSMSDPQRILTAVSEARSLVRRHPPAAAHPELALLAEDAATQALFRAGRLAQAADAATAATSASIDGFESEYVQCLARLAFVEAWFGHCRRASQLAQQAETVADRAGIPATDRAGVAELALAWACVETRDLRAAGEHVAAAERACTDAAPSFDVDFVATMTSIVRSRIARAGRDLSLAREELLRRGSAPPTWTSEQLVVERAALDLVGGRTKAVLAMPELRTPPAREAATRLRIRARLLSGLAAVSESELPDPDDSSLLVRIDSLLLAALYARRHGDDARCDELLEQALRDAAPEHLRRPFQEAPEPLRRALTSRPDIAARHAWLFSPRRSGPGTHPRGEPAPGAATSGGAALAEPLTEKELEVLRRLAQLMTTEETAASMFISVNTVRTHVRSILRKLGVRRRNQAIRRARDLGLLPRNGSHDPDAHDSESAVAAYSLGGKSAARAQPRSAT